MVSHRVMLLLLLLLLMVLVTPVLLLARATIKLGFLRHADFVWKIIISLFPLLLVDFLDGSQLLLEFHSPVLEPDLDLPLSQTQGVSNLNATSPSQVVVEVELLLQLECLEPGVRLASSSPWTAVRTSPRKAL